MNVGEQIKELRLKNGWTQEQLSNLLNVSRSTVSSWEVGRTYPDIRTLIDLSDLFDMTIDALLREDSKMVTSIDFNKKQKNRFRLGIFVLSFISICLILFITVNHFRQPVISFEKEEITADLDEEPFSRNDIKEINIQNNIVTVTFKTSLKGSYTGYFADGGEEAYLNLYKKKVVDDDSLKYEGTTQIDLSTMPKIKHLTVFIK